MARPIRGKLPARTLRPKPRRDRLLGELRNPPYKSVRRTAEAKRLLKKAAKKQKRLDRRTQNNWRYRKSKAVREEIQALKRHARVLNPPGRSGPAKPVQPPLLINRLVRAQHLGIGWIRLIQRMQKEGLVTVRSDTNLRKVIADAIRPFNRGAASDFETGGNLYFPRGRMSLELLFRNARSQPIAGIVTKGKRKAKLAAEKRAREIKFLTTRRWY